LSRGILLREAGTASGLGMKKVLYLLTIESLHIFRNCIFIDNRKQAISNYIDRPESIKSYLGAADIFYLNRPCI
jgi:hypothetical protein